MLHVESNPGLTDYRAVTLLTDLQEAEGSLFWSERHVSILYNQRPLNNF